MNGLPKGWTLAQLGEVCLDRVEQAEPGRDPVPYIDIGSIDRGSKAVGELDSVTATTAPTRARQWVREGDVLVSMTRPNLNAVALVPARLDGAVASTGFDVLRPIGVMPEWVFNRVRSHDFIEDVCKGLQGVVYPAIRPRDVRQHQFPVPPLPEQHRIVAAIEDHFSRLDAAEALLERVQRNLKRYRASVLKAAVEGRLVPTEADLARAEGRAYEPAIVLLARILEERRRRWKAEGGKGTYKEPVAPDTTDLHELPEGWCWATVDALSEVKGGITKNQKRQSTDPLIEVPYLRVANVQRGYLDLSEVTTIPATRGEIEELRLRPGDVLFNEGGDRDKLGRGWVWNGEIPVCIHQNHVFRARIYGGYVRPKFLSWYGNTEGQHYFFQQGKQTTNLASINMTMLRALPVPLPPAAEQERIEQAVEDTLSITDVNERVVNASLVRCTRLRQSILKWAFEGRLADQDPADEPAAALLERIRVSSPCCPRSGGRSRARTVYVPLGGEGA